MTRTSRRRKRTAPTESPLAVRQIERKVLRNRFAPLEPLDEEQLEFIHDISLRIVEEEGIEVLGDLALDLFRQGRCQRRRAGRGAHGPGLVTRDRGQGARDLRCSPA